MPKPTAKLNKLLADKSGKINTNVFNFVENLLVFRTMEILSVQPESGVKFRISRQDDPGICLLIHVDNKCFPVVDEGVSRPDYLAIYLHGDHCICTIIEMKSTAEKNLKHGVEQIKTLAGLLKSEFKIQLPRNLELTVQGILLCSANAGVPNALISQVEKGDYQFSQRSTATAQNYFPMCRRSSIPRCGLRTPHDVPASGPL